MSSSYAPLASTLYMGVRGESEVKYCTMWNASDAFSTCSGAVRRRVAKHLINYDLSSHFGSRYKPRSLMTHHLTWPGVTAWSVGEGDCTRRRRTPSLLKRRGAAQKMARASRAPFSVLHCSGAGGARRLWRLIGFGGFGCACAQRHRPRRRDRWRGPRRAIKVQVTSRCCRFLPRKFHVLWAEFKKKDIIKYF